MPTSTGSTSSFGDIIKFDWIRTPMLLKSVNNRVSSNILLGRDFASPFNELAGGERFCTARQGLSLRMGIIFNHFPFL